MFKAERSDGSTLSFGVPASLMIVHEIFGVFSAPATRLRGLAAAVGICWEAGVELRRPALFAAHGCNAATYGGAVFDELVKRGWTSAEIVEVGNQCLGPLADKLPSEPEVAEVAKNSEPAESAG